MRLYSDLFEIIEYFIREIFSTNSVAYSQESFKIYEPVY